MYISLKLSELNPSTLAVITANLIENIGNGVNKTHTNRMTIAETFSQLIAVVGDDADAMVGAAGGDTDALRAILMEFA
jgi:hypothetical protein